MKRLLTIVTLLAFFGVMFFSTSLMGRQNTQVKLTLNKVSAKTISPHQAIIKEQTLSFKFSFFYEKIKTLIFNWFEPQEPVIDDYPRYDSEGPNNGEYEDVVPIKDNGGLGVDK